MATHVHVILRRDVDKLGHAGELVRVRPGFARNYLLPRSLAVVATDTNVKQIEHERKLAVAAAAKQKGVAEGVAAQAHHRHDQTRVAHRAVPHIDHVPTLDG
jgi:large subunit ribosomal protein L9